MVLWLCNIDIISLLIYSIDLKLLTDLSYIVLHVRVSTLYATDGFIDLTFVFVWKWYTYVSFEMW